MARFVSDILPAQRLRLAIAAACFLCSGLLALIYEICWIRKASLVFGATSFAMSTVLGVFFAGLALGSYLCGRYARLTLRPFTSYAVIELILGMAAIATPTAFRIADWVFGWIYPFVYDHFWAVCIVRLALVAAILLPPSVLIGATLPLFCRGFVRNDDRVQRGVGLLYGVNTLGAALGCAACGFVMLPTWGADATLYYAGASNLAVAGVAWWATRRNGAVQSCNFDTTKDSIERPVPLPKRWGRNALGLVFFLTGFVALGHEIVWARFLSLLMFNTVYAYTLTLSVILVGMVLGSLLAATPLLQTSRPATLLGGLQAAIAVTVLGTLFMPVESWRAWLNPDSVVSQVALIAIIMLPSATLSGAAFPVAATLATRRADDAAAGVGWLAALNTCGGVAGSLLIGFGGIPILGLHATVLLTTAISVVAALLAWWWIDQQLTSRTRISLSVIACGLWLLVPLASDTGMPADFLTAPNRLVELREGLTGNIAVVRADEGHLRLEIDRLWQGENRHTHQVIAAHVPMALHDDPRRILVVGLGPGQTASRFLMYPIDRLDCVEIERELISLLPKYFQGGWLRDPRVRCIVDDGRNYVWHTDDRYDVISVEVGQAFRPGVASFYTQDFYARAKEKLHNSGLLTQFVSLEFFNDEELRAVVGTFADVFPECALFHNRTELILVGKRDGKLKLKSERLQVLAANALINRDLSFSYWGAADSRLYLPSAFAANFLAGGRDLRRFAGGSRIASDHVPWLEFSTSSHGTPEIEIAIKRLQRYLTPMDEFFDSADEQEQQKIAAIRQRNLDNLLSEECIWQAHRNLQEGQSARAVVSLRKALQWNQDHVGARVMLGDALAREGSFSAATEELSAALARNPGLALIETRLKAIAAIQSQR